MKAETSSSAYDSASSRAQAPQAGAALKSTSSGFPLDLASESAASASFFHSTAISLSSSGIYLSLMTNCRSTQSQFQSQRLATADTASTEKAKVFCILSFLFSVSAVAGSELI